MLKLPARLPDLRCHRQGVLVLAVAALLGVSGLSWIARERVETSPLTNQRRSLLDLLQQIGQPPPAASAATMSHRPPAAQPWKSPLRAQCAVPDAALADRLNSIYRRLDAKAVRLKIDPSNFGHRFNKDAFGQPLDPRPRVVVLHETVYGLTSAVNTFITNHPNDDDQVSYHTLIGEKGQIVQALDPSQRAFGAGFSAFNGQWVITNPKMPGSINNFALHLSLETPLDGENEAPGHSGYTQAQYDATAVVLARWMHDYGIPPANITTHRHVDLGGERADPRSFHWDELQRRLAALGALC